MRERGSREQIPLPPLPLGGASLSSMSSTVKEGMKLKEAASLLPLNSVDLRIQREWEEEGPTELPTSSWGMHPHSLM